METLELTEIQSTFDLLLKSDTGSLKIDYISDSTINISGKIHGKTIVASIHKSPVYLGDFLNGTGKTGITIDCTVDGQKAYGNIDTDIDQVKKWIRSVNSVIAVEKRFDRQDAYNFIMQY